ncbi:hypothetical protein ARTSIC4J27_875 [Pseudarthrobacter siccitolerans]|uniref:Uncharacterized protein n=1 Tax=Pseudarthrobacter siccitolerans TaxID=861266 RepID=A0A024GZN1_9MICC|nr:hypothetical protein [Pseudarthrobacter siccitolerans]CCQ44944.1 hypothetical protein ARTSIC4J27_875 [Pseudarthrobacter siccitolerans]
MHDPLIEAIHDHEPLSDPLEEINLRLAIAATDIAELRAEVARLDRALEESRRLNLKAAELLNLVYSHVDGSSEARWNPSGALGRPALDGIPE